MSDPDHPRRVALEPTSVDHFAELRRLFDDPAFMNWGGPGLATDQQIRAKYCGARAPAVECFLVRQYGVVVGLAQLHDADDGGEGGGLDLILLPSVRGRGIGREVVRLLIARATTVRGWERITVDPDLANGAGIAFWRSVGFTEVVRRDGNDDRAAYLLMRWESHGGPRPSSTVTKPG
jgi:aminoglycoside 6'-N-acetyltransferase